MASYQYVYHMDGVSKEPALDECNDVSMKMAEDYTDELMERMTELQDQIEAKSASPQSSGCGSRRRPISQA